VYGLEVSEIEELYNSPGFKIIYNNTLKKAFITISSKVSNKTKSFVLMLLKMVYNNDSIINEFLHRLRIEKKVTIGIDIDKELLIDLIDKYLGSCTCIPVIVEELLNKLYEYIDKNRNIESAIKYILKNLTDIGIEKVFTITPRNVIINVTRRNIVCEFPCLIISNIKSLFTNKLDGFTISDIKCESLEKSCIVNIHFSKIPDLIIFLRCNLPILEILHGLPDCEISQLSLSRIEVGYLLQYLKYLDRDNVKCNGYYIISTDKVRILKPLCKILLKFFEYGKCNFRQLKISFNQVYTFDLILKFMLSNDIPFIEINLEIPSIGIFNSESIWKAFSPLAEYCEEFTYQFFNPHWIIYTMLNEVKNGKCNNLFIFGARGCGKTMSIIKYIIQNKPKNILYIAYMNNFYIPKPLIKHYHEFSKLTGVELLNKIANSINGEDYVLIVDDVHYLLNNALKDYELVEYVKLFLQLLNELKIRKVFVSDEPLRYYANKFMNIDYEVSKLLNEFEQNEFENYVIEVKYRLTIGDIKYLLMLFNISIDDDVFPKFLQLLEQKTFLNPRLVITSFKIFKKHKVDRITVSNLDYVNSLLEYVYQNYERFLNKELIV